MEINPKSKSGLTNQVASDQANELTFKRGGLLTLGLIFPDSTTTCSIDGRIVPNGISVPWKAWGTYPQWSTASFTLYDVDQDHTYYVGAQSDSYIGGAGGNWGYITYSWFPGGIDIAYGINLVPDSSEAMPPDSYLNYEYGPGNPYDPSQAKSVTLPFDMSYRLIISQVKPSANDELVLLSAEHRSVLRNLCLHEGDTLILGPYEQGTELKFGIVSGAGVLVKGDTLYPQVWDYGGGNWRMNVEDWTDLDFGDAVVLIEPNEKNPDHLELWSESETVYYGDTVDVEITPTDIDSTFAPLGDDANYEFSVELINGTDQYGELLYGGDNGTFFEHIPSIGGVGVGVRFAANQREPDSTVDLWFHLTATYIGGGGGATKIVGPGGSHGKAISRSVRERKVLAIHKPIRGTGSITDASKTLPAPTQARVNNIAALAKAKQTNLNDGASQSISSKFIRSNSVLENTEMNSTKSLGGASIESIPFVNSMENDWEWGTHEPGPILLGQTIYFQAVADPINEKRLFFNRLKQTSEKHDPELQGVQFTVELVQGDILGVYYEKKDEEGTDLRSDILRVIGRYWKEVKSDKDKYIVRIKATSPGRSGEIQVQVNRPDMLGDPNLTDDARKSQVTDVSGNTLKLDDLIILYAGQTGIPPQIIKGQIEHETQFQPSWRYEPFTDLNVQKDRSIGGTRDRYLAASLPFNIVSGQTITGLPSSHTNVHPTPYNTTPQGIGDFLVAYWSSRYVKKGNGSDPDTIIASPELTQRWSELYDSFQEWDNIEDVPDDQLRKAVHVRLKAEVLDGTADKDYTLTAQTRKMTSYGFIQMMYIKAVDSWFKETGSLYAAEGSSYVDKTDGSLYPEKLNEQNFLFPRYVDLTLQHLRASLPGSLIPQANWQDGFEKAWTKALKKYNPGESNYGKAVMGSSNNYLPSNSKGAL